MGGLKRGATRPTGAQWNNVLLFIHQVDLGQAKRITALETQGGYNKWSKNYQVKYSMDNSEWKSLQGGHTFDGPPNAATKKRQEFGGGGFSARWLRLYPLSLLH